MPPRMIDHLFATLRAKRFWMNDDEDKSYSIRMEDSAAAKLRVNLRKAQIFLYEDDAMRAGGDLVDNLPLLADLSQRARLPVDKIWIEPASFSQEGDMADDISNMAYFIERIDDGFRITPVSYDIPAEPAYLTSANFYPLAEVSDEYIAEEQRAFANQHSTDVDHLDMTFDPDVVRFVSRIEKPIVLYGPNRIIERKYARYITPEIRKSVYRCARDAIALVTLLNLSGKIALDLDDEKMPSQPRDPKTRQDYLAHRVVRLPLRLDKFAEQLEKEFRGSGTRHRRHGVIAHWCVSRRKGKPECRTVRRVCKPVPVDINRNNCAFCEKHEWRRRDHERGDATLGFIQHDYLVTKD